jgi:2-octaprenyl-6-methoxyphenol hydroxylase
MDKIQKYDVQIVGGGLAGLSLALALGKNNIKTLLIDNLENPNKTNKTDGRTTALMESSVNYLDNLGIWKNIKQNSCKISCMRIINIVPPNKISNEVIFESNKIGINALAHNIDNHILRTELCNEISKFKSIKHLFNSKCKNAIQKNDGWVVNTDKGKYSAKLTIGADGRSSTIRKCAGINFKKKDYNQSAIVFNINHTQNTNNTSTEFMYPEGAFTFVPMGKNKSAIVWVEQTDQVNKLILNDKLLKQKFIQKSQKMFGEIEILTKPKSFPLSKIIAETNISDKLCLIGEAHHGITPVAAQGLNLSLRDSAILAELIIKNKDDDFNKILISYNKKRLKDIKTRIIGTDIFHNFSRFSNPISIGIKSIATNMLNRMPQAKNQLMKLGLSFPDGLPNMMRKNNKI